MDKKNGFNAKTKHKSCDMVNKKITQGLFIKLNFFWDNDKNLDVKITLKRSKNVWIFQKIFISWSFFFWIWNVCSVTYVYSSSSDMVTVFTSENKNGSLGVLSNGKLNYYFFHKFFYLISITDHKKSCTLKKK